MTTFGGFLVAVAVLLAGAYGVQVATGNQPLAAAIELAISTQGAAHSNAGGNGGGNSTNTPASTNAHANSTTSSDTPENHGRAISAEAKRLGVRIVNNLPVLPDDSVAAWLAQPKNRFDVLSDDVARSLLQLP